MQTASTSAQPIAAEDPLQAGEVVSPGRFASLYWSGSGLVAASWISAAAFGLYILGFYLGAIRSGQMQRWNENLTGLYDNNYKVAFLAMTAHLATGAIILLLGPIQLIAKIRSQWPSVHRWIGRLYVLTALVAGLGGLGFIVSKGTIGAGPMDAGFGLYGLLMGLAAVATYLHARGRRFENHRAWALRLFALAIGSWLYRMDYGFWLLAVHGIGHTRTFHGPFDIVMSFFFYLPNLLVVELYLRAGRFPSHRAVRLSSAVLLNAATLMVAIGTYYFLRYYWGPGIINGLFSRRA